jgi:hypothetical protein
MHRWILLTLEEEEISNGSGFFWFWVLRISGKFPEPSAASFFKKYIKLNENF